MLIISFHWLIFIGQLTPSVTCDHDENPQLKVAVINFEYHVIAQADSRAARRPKPPNLPDTGQGPANRTGWGTPDNKDRRQLK